MQVKCNFYDTLFIDNLKELVWSTHQHYKSLNVSEHQETKINFKWKWSDLMLLSMIIIIPFFLLTTGSPSSLKMKNYVTFPMVLRRKKCAGMLPIIICFFFPVNFIAAVELVTVCNSSAFIHCWLNKENLYLKHFSSSSIHFASTFFFFVHCASSSSFTIWFEAKVRE